MTIYPPWRGAKTIRAHEIALQQRNADSEEEWRLAGFLDTWRRLGAILNRGLVPTHRSPGAGNGLRRDQSAESAAKRLDDEQRRCQDQDDRPEYYRNQRDRLGDFMRLGLAGAAVATDGSADDSAQLQHEENGAAKRSGPDHVDIIVPVPEREFQERGPRMAADGHTTEPVRVHDFPGDAVGKAIPYGVGQDGVSR